MIRVRRLTTALLDAWLIDQQLPNGQPRYRLRLWRDAAAALPAVQGELREYIDEAFEDARQRVRAGFQDALSPFNDPALDPAANFPALLHRNTLQGYFGETLAVLAVEHWGAAGYDDWQVPAFLFRFHTSEFQHLEDINRRIREGEPYEPDANAEIRMGRTGDDALAFRRAPDGHIVDILTLEAKCLGQNRNDKIEEAHLKLSGAGALPSGIRELIELLSDYNGAEAQSWQEALIRFRAHGYRVATRHDGVAYATGHIPAHAGRQAWMPPQPHVSYTANRHLEGMEFQFADLDGLIDALYRGA